MPDTVRIITYDVGTTGIKSCLFTIDQEIKLIDSEMAGYELSILEHGGAEQDPLEWWAAMCSTTRKLLARTGTDPRSIAGISFCSQMQGLVLVDQDGLPVRRAMSYMDQRAVEELREGMAHGLQVAGVNVIKLIKSIRETGAVAASVKDPVWKYKWVQKNEPELFSRVYKWLDVKEFLIHRCTGRFIMTQDSAFATLLYNIREGQQGWSKAICRMTGVNMEHLPEIIRSTDRVGEITAAAARELGLAAGTAVFGGGGDASLIGVGAGAVELGDTHLYMGTSGWVSTVVDRSIVDATAMIAAIVGAQPGRFNYFAELETAGKCFEWVKDHLALDEIGIYLEKKAVHESKETVYKSLYDYMTEVVKTAAPGSGGVIFTPWLHGNRCPFEDPHARGIFFNISLDTGKTELIRAVLEGVCYHLRWMLEAQEKKIKCSPVVRFVGGGALSEATCQILADVLGREVETVESPQNVGAVGAAAVVAVGLGLISSFTEAKNLIPVSSTYSPNFENSPVYNQNYEVFKKLYRNNKKSFALLNSGVL
ncbi:MAG: FGGY-family carbohydrate kinase [Dethiobacteria bacterium]|nr:carbohydrate kinase [Bacillota bacterium]